MKLRITLNCRVDKAKSGILLKMMIRPDPLFFASLFHLYCCCLTKHLFKTQFHERYILDFVYFQLNLTVTRKYGTRFHIQVSFDIVPLSSLPGTDYLIPDSTELLFKAGQRTANITILIPPHESKRRRRFQAKLTKAVQPQNIYGGL